jgi:hypothetical protein
MSDSCAPLLQCSPVDANGCSNGFGAIYRIYPKGTRVQIAAPTSYGRLVFSHWVVIDNTDTMEPRDVQESILRIDKMEHNMQIFCHYEEKKELHATEREQSPAVRELITSRFKSMPSEAEVEQFWKSESQRVKAHLSASRGGRLDAPPHGRPTRILNEPNGSNIAYLPQTAKVEVLAGPKEIDGLKWIQIDYRGVVGWVTTA